VQTTLLGLAIAFIIALLAALVGPYFIDWNQFRPQFEAEASKIVGAPVRVAGALDARLLPAPSLRLRSVVVGGANDLGKVHADKLDVEFSLGSLMRGEWRANELTVNGLGLDLGLDSQGRIDWPASTGTFNWGSLSVDRLNMTGRIALHDAASRGTLELNDIAFSGDVRSLAGAVRGDGNFMLSGTRYPFRVSSGQSADGSGTRVHLNIDPGQRRLSAELDGVLSFEARAPRFDGTATLAVPAAPKAKGNDALPTPWRITSKVKADPATARLEQLEASYGPEDNALKFSGLGDIRFGASPLLHAVLSARQLDADKFAAKENSSQNSSQNPLAGNKDSAAEPIRLLPGLRALIAATPALPVPAQVEFSSEQIMLGGRPVQNIVAEFRADAKSLAIDRLDFRAPGSTRVSLSSNRTQAGVPGSLKGALDVESSDPDTLLAWLQGRSEVSFRGQKPLRLHGDLSVAADRIAIDAMKAEIDGGAIEGHLAFANGPANDGSRFDAELKAERLDVDAAGAFLRSLAGPQAEWPSQAQLSLDIDRAISAGQELHPFIAKFGYDPKTLSLDRLNFGSAGGVTMEGAGSFDRINATGRLTLDASATSLGQVAGLIAPLAPALTSRLNAIPPGPGPARCKLTLNLDKDAAQADHADARAVIDLDAPQLKGSATITAKPPISALRGIDVDTLRNGEIGIESKLSSEQGGALLALLGLDRAVAAGDGPAQFEASVAGAWRAPLRIKVKLSGSGLDAEAQGSTEPWAQQPSANLNLKVRSADLAPLFNLKSPGTPAQNVSLSSRVSLKGNRLTFDDLDSTISGSRLRGRVALTLDEEKNVEGEVGLDTLVLAPAFGFALGAAGRDAAEPLGLAMVKGWRGRIAFQALRGELPGGAELRPVGGSVKSDGQSLTFEGIKGGIGGGEATATIDVKPTSGGVALNARVQLGGVDGSALRYRGLAMPAGRTSLQMTMASQGRSASALTGALSGSGTVTLESARIAGLDPRAFDTAIRASDSGQATDDVKLRQIVEPVLSSGGLLVTSAQIPFAIRDGRLRVGATTLDADGARAIVSGGYDIAADQADIRASLESTAVGATSGRPEIRLFAVGSPDALDRTIDVAPLSSWLAVRAIDRETRRLDSLEHGDQPQANPASVPPPPALPSATTPLRLPPKPKVSMPRPPAAPATPGAPPVVSQQLAPPLPPPVEVRPAPAAIRPAPKPRPPLVLTPPAKPLPAN
jgi:large subunit ribosomal protein L24